MHSMRARVRYIHGALFIFSRFFRCSLVSLSVSFLSNQLGYSRQKKKNLRTFFEITMCSPCIKSTQYPLTWKSFGSKYFSLDGISNDYQIEIVPRFAVGESLLLHPLRGTYYSISSVSVQFTHRVYSCERVCVCVCMGDCPSTPFFGIRRGRRGGRKAEMNIKYSRDFVPVL